MIWVAEESRDDDERHSREIYDLLSHIFAAK
jgi:hypothetical protein